MNRFNIFKFKYGKERRNIFNYMRIGFLLKGTVDFVSLLPFVDRKFIFNLIDEIQLKFGSDALNDYIIKDDELLKFRIDRTIEKALKEYENKT
jgi:uncharacterized protein YeeX (DUF496 family)